MIGGSGGAQRCDAADAVNVVKSGEEHRRAEARR